MKKYVFLAVTALLIFANLPVVRVLSISNRKNFSERIYSKSAMTQGFVISYTHSVNKGRVHDYYKIEKNGNLTVFKTVFVSYGAGIPESYETAGAKFRVTEEGYEISGLNRTQKRLLMAVGMVAEHSIALGSDFKSENERFLKDFFKAQTSLIFEVRRVSVVNYLLTNKI